MHPRHRKSRNYALIFVVLLFSVSVIGNVDSRLHIGGGYWAGDSELTESEWEEPATIVDSAERAERARRVFGVDISAVGDTGIGVGAESTRELMVDQSVLTSSETEAVEGAGLEAAVDEVENRLTDAADVSDGDAVSSAVDAGADSDSGLDSLKVSERSSEAESAVVAKDERAQQAKEEAEAEPEKKADERPSIHVHTVQSGETLWDIASSYGISVDSILSTNDIRNSNRIQVGQELKILSVEGVLHEVVVGESLWDISQRYEVTMDEIVRANSISNPSRIQPSTEIVIPGATQTRPRDVLVVNGQLQRAFHWPTQGRISSPFGPRWGRMHNGIDIAVPSGTPIKAAAEGTVKFSGWNGGYGYLVIIDHGNNVETYYAHNSRNLVDVGQRVDRGQTIARSGNTGNSTGPHLHFEIRHRGRPVDPQKYLR